MNEQEIKEFFQNIQNLKLSKTQKKRMLRLFQVRGSNKKNCVMSYKDFTSHLLNNKGKIISLVLGPKWNRLVFVDIDVEV
tara:strand:+ start:347 stop:586 length:240 start_codon:yes stop_codon:yes gene_type:complete